MKYLFIFLTLPFFVCADQQNLDKYQIEYLKRHQNEFIYQELYNNYVEIYFDGHLWTPYLFHHSDNCPCYKD